MQVIPYQPNPLLGQLIGIGANYLADYMSEKRARDQRETYHNSLMDALGAYEKKKEGITEDVTQQYQPTGLTQEPTGYEFQPNQAQIAQQQVPMADVQGAGYNMVPTGTQPMTRPVNEITKQQRPLSQQERLELDDRTRLQLQAMGAKVPREDRVEFDIRDRSKDDQEGRTDAYGRPLPGAQVWRGFDAETQEPILGLVTRSRNKPTTTKYKGKDIIWDVPAGTQGYYATEAGTQGKQISSSVNLQRLWNDFIDEPTPEKEALAMSAAQAKGLTPVKQDLSNKEKIRNWFGADIPEYLFVDKNGQYVRIDESGNTVKMQPKKSSSTPAQDSAYKVGGVYKDGSGKKIKYLGKKDGKDKWELAE
jgi:hypothetical protein